MTGFNLPPGCNVSDIPGNRPEDIEMDEAMGFAQDQLWDADLDPSELRRAVLIGIAAVKAEREEIKRVVAEELRGADELIHELEQRIDQLLNPEDFEEDFEDGEE